MITTKSGGHWYDANGSPQHDADLRTARKEKLFPSITTIDKASFPNPILEQWKMNEALVAAAQNARQPDEPEDVYAQRIYDLSLRKSIEAAEFGTALHDAIEHYPQLPLDTKLMPWFDKFVQYWEAKVDSTVASELVVTDKDIGVAGRLDRIVLLKDGRRAVVDYKTQRVRSNKKGKKEPAFYDSWARQLAFYAVCDAKSNGAFPAIPTCLSVVIDSNEGGLVYDKEWSHDEIVNAYDQFLHGAWLWFYSRDYWPVDEFAAQWPVPLPG
jgi:hypothetical protein